MRKFQSIFLALLLSFSMTGVVFAANIPEYIDPDDGGPEIWTTEVYNNSGAALDIGDIVVWDIGSSTGDNDNWVTTTTTADTFLVAGVVYPVGITTAATGTIAIKGPVSVDVITASATAAGQLICSSATAGSGANCTTQTGQAAAIGFTNAAASSGTVMVTVQPH